MFVGDVYMSEYLLSVMGIVLFSSILLAIVPMGKTGELIKGIARMACVVAILSPVVHFFVGGEKIEDIFGESGIQTETAFIQYCSEERIDDAENCLLEDLKQTYANVNDVKIEWQRETVRYWGYEGEEIKITQVIVFLGETVDKTVSTEIESYLLREYGCEGKVVGNVEIVE